MIDLLIFKKHVGPLSFLSLIKPSAQKIWFQTIKIKIQ